MTAADLADCEELVELKSSKNIVVVPWAVDTVKKYNECAAGRAALADKVREHNKKSEKNKNEKAPGGVS